MKVLKRINNNVVSCLEESGQEVIAMGKGLGFSLHEGDILPPQKAEKIFRMQSPDQTQQLASLFSALPPHQIELCSRIVDRAAKDLERPLSPSIYLTLTDHVCFAIQRLENGTMFQNALLPEVRTFYPREYALGKYALELIRQELGIVFPEDEAANIALHFVNAESENSISDTLRITHTLRDILVILNGWPELHFNPKSHFYDEFTVHLKFWVLRSFSGEVSQTSEPEFLQMVERCYPTEFRCVQQIAQGLAKRSGHTLPREEIAYLAVSLHRTCG